MKIEQIFAPNSKDIGFLTKKLSQETPDFDEMHPFAFFIRNKNGQIIAGCDGSVIFGSIHTRQLWVDANQRKSGLGRRLLTQVHDYGRTNRCKIATLATMSFHRALEFYKKLGYTVDFERPGYAQNSSCIFLVCSL
jgi:ribosomal protein S18 acetylase RimI-like enzyme